MPSFAERLSIVVEELQEIVADMEAATKPKTLLSPNPRNPARGFKIVVEKSIAHYASSYNDDGEPIMTAHPGGLYYKQNDIANIIPTVVKAADGRHWYGIHDFTGEKGEILYLSKNDGMLG